MTQELPAFPWRHVPLEFAGGDRAAGALELAAPLALGQRGLVVSPPRCGATTVLGWIGRAVVAALPDAAVHVIMVERPVEERIDWATWLPDARLHGTTSDDAGGAAAHAAMRAPFHAAAAQAVAGRDVVVLVDSLGSLARALVATDDTTDERVLDSGMAQTTMIELRQLFGLARAGTGDQGSLTIVATVGTETSHPIDELLLHELVGTGNVEWRLNSDAMEGRLFPPVDVLASGARRIELILGEDEAQRRGELRGVIDERGTAPGLAMLLDELDRNGPLARVLAMRAGEDEERPLAAPPAGFEIPPGGFTL